MFFELFGERKLRLIQVTDIERYRTELAQGIPDSIRQAFITRLLKAKYDELSAKLADLKCRGKGPLKISERCKRAGRRDEYESLYGLFCIDTHGNTPALAERHISEKADGGLLVSFFGQYDPWVVIRRLDLGLGFLLGSARDIHGAFEVPAPQIDELASKLEKVKAERANRQPDEPDPIHAAAKPA